MTAEVQADFRLPGRRDLLYLVLCTLTKNALQALRGQPDARLRISAGCERRPARARKAGSASPTTARAFRRTCWRA